MRNTASRFNGPSLTAVIDVYSRMVLGFAIYLEKPSAFAAGLAIAHAILPKERLAESANMIFTMDRKRIIAKLINACHDVEDALSQSASGARYDPVIIPQALRNELSVLRDDLAR